MSVRDGLLAILTLGPAYGLQLHAEFMSRAPHRKPVNVGQIYATLERLTKQGLVDAAGSTHDGLPLYAATQIGSEAATSWMTTVETPPLPEWTEMLDQILVTATVRPDAALQTAKEYRRWWEEDLASSRDRLAEESVLRLALLAREAQALAALAWLGAVVEDLAELPDARQLSSVRPARGRRPRGRR